MRGPLRPWILAACAALLFSCPKAPPSNVPSSNGTTGDTPAPAPAPPVPPDAATLTRATILRAADRRIVDDDLRAALADDEPALRAAAVLALGQIGLASSSPDVVRAAADAAPAVRAAAAFSLGLIADPATIAEATKLASDGDPAVRAA